MDSPDERWQRADRLFEAALDLSPKERTSLLERECHDDPELRALVARLIAGTERDDSWLPPGGGLNDAAGELIEEDADEDADLSGSRVDRYRLQQEIGRGGMAVVYLAERTDCAFDQQLALKLIKRGFDTDEVIGRFERERRILARIRHPNIARFIDGGTTDDGRPFFAMELVEGVPIDQYCKERSLSLQRRLQLFLDVARAVDHAHSHLVVHRDIKPSNVLVGEHGEVKLLDFGIARVLEADEADLKLTRTRQHVLTPAFASPEQVRGEPVTTTSDVYQLGALLYQLVTGSPPHAAADSWERLSGAILEESPAVPSSVVSRAERREVFGDLDNIVLMALRKEPDRRYASVGAMIGDVERYLTGHPISARPDTWSYRTSKFLHRHKVGVASAGAFLALLIGFAITMALQNGRITRERDRANLEAANAEEVSEFLVELFRVADPSQTRGETITAREVLDRGAGRVGQELGERPALRARLMDTIGRVYQSLGLYDSAQPLIEEALELRRGLTDSPDMEVAKSLNHVAWLLETRGDFDAAEPLYREALAIARHTFGEEHPQVAAAINDLALLLYHQGELDAAEPLHRQSLELRRRLLASGDPELSDSLNNLALLLLKKGDVDAAEDLHQEALSIRRAAYGELHPHVAISLNGLGQVEQARGNPEGAEAYFLGSLRIRRKLFGDRHPEVAQSLNNLASQRVRRGDLEGAETMFRDVIAVDRQLLGEEHPDYGQSLGNLAFVLAKQRRFDEAAAIYEEALGVLEQALDGSHWLVGLNRGNYGECLLRLGRLEDAERSLLSAHQVLLNVLGATNDRTTRVEGLLAELRSRRESG